MIFSCPGSQKFKQPYPETMKCARCDRDIEIWSDENAAVCSCCGNRTARKTKQSCIDWCKDAKLCIGEDSYNKYIGNKKRR